MDILECIKEFIPDDIVKRTKELYDEAYKARSFTVKKSQALPELIIDGFDTEQIWQQIELENKEVLGKEGLENISKVLANTKWDFSFKSSDSEAQKSNDKEDNEEDEGKNEEMVEEKRQFEESEDDSVNTNIKRKAKHTSSNTKKKRKTEVDDKFFSLAQMSDYLTKMEKMETSDKKKKKSDDFDEDKDDDDDDDMSIDLFNEIPEDDEEESDDENKTGKSYKYNDFFDSPESENEVENDDNHEKDDYHNEEDDEHDDSKYEFDDEHNDNKRGFDDEDDSGNVNNDEKHIQSTQKKVKFNLLNNSDDSDSSKEVENEENEIENKSSFEARKERLMKKIARLEKEAISEKPWQLKGETTANTRPKNSLLEEFVEFDTGLRAAPIMTEKTTLKLEDIIRSRIKDKAWDDVEKKFKPVETPIEYKKKLVMNQEKSKESLAQIYENEYVKQREALTGEKKDEEDKEEPPEHIEIREKMHSLFRKLDALSNFHYTPKLAKPEIKIVSNIPAINMEEVAPVGTSDATLLAPEEVKGKPKGDLLGKSERSKTDKSRERRKKKLKQHYRAAYKNKEEENDQKNKKNKKSKTDGPKITGSNILNNPDSSDQHAIKSSTAFFTKLQNEVTTGIQQKTGMNKAKKKK